jgi:phosphotriesterase-related protein
MTVNGPVAADRLGITLPHEHLLTRHQGPNVDTVDPDLAVEELATFARFGGVTLVEQTTVGIGRDAKRIKRIADLADVQVVMATGFYKDAWLPAEVRELSVEQLAARMVVELLEGIDGTQVRAGVIGEIGISRPITPVEERVIAAVGRVLRVLGTWASIHFDIGAHVREHRHVLALLEKTKEPHWTVSCWTTSSVAPTRWRLVLN